MERAAQREYRIHILDMGIERERTVSADAVGGCQLLHVDDHGDEIAQACLMEHGTLGLARRARGIDHVGEAVGAGQVNRSLTPSPSLKERGVVSFAVRNLRSRTIYSPLPERGVGGEAFHKIINEEGLGGSGAEIAFGLLGGKHIVGGDEHLRLGVLEHVAETLVGIFKVEWGIGGTGLVDRQYGQRELLETVEHHAHEIVGLNAEIDELAGQRVRVAVHLAVGELAVPIHHGRGIGRALSLFRKEVGKGLAQVYVNLLTRTYLNNTLGLLVAHDADTGQRSIGIGHHAFYSYLDGIGQTLHQTGGILAIVVFHANAGLSLHFADKERDGELGHLELHIIQLQRSALTDVLADHAQLVHKLYLGRQSVVSGNLCKRIVLVVQCLVEVFAHLLQEFLYGLFSDGCTQGQGIDKHPHGAADVQVRATAGDSGDADLLTIGKTRQ